MGKDVKDLDRVMAFVKVVEQSSFHAAAKDLRVSASVVSKLISLLEEDMGVLLLRRSTRRLSLTDAGADFYARCAAALASIKSAKEMAAEQSDAFKGVINIQATLSVAIKVLGPAIRSFAAKYPDISFNVAMAEVPSRVIDSGYDIVMIHRPTSREKKVACRTLRPVRFLICASDSYLKAAGVPMRSGDLARFNCLINDKQIRPNEWKFRDGAKETTVKVRGNLRMNDSLALHDAVLRGVGIGRLPDYHVESNVKQGELRVLFDNCVYDIRTITAAYPRSKFTPPRVTLFLDFLEEFIARSNPRAHDVGKAAAQSRPYRSGDIDPAVTTH
ncbi:MAG TPA: LysR substrate-binding domain-containing protein [Alphaproteobacteria bacterium]|nr:LysR substrate-binding domain-containing protein [Alphaproteobacteria bacterium]